MSVLESSLYARNQERRRIRTGCTAFLGYELLLFPFSESQGIAHHQFRKVGLGEMRLHFDACREIVQLGNRVMNADAVEEERVVAIGECPHFPIEIDTSTQGKRHVAIEECVFQVEGYRPRGMGTVLPILHINVTKMGIT